MYADVSDTEFPCINTPSSTLHQDMYIVATFGCKDCYKNFALLVMSSYENSNDNNNIQNDHKNCNKHINW